ncbi:GNAT family N-acetyltransferase [Phototrophicus methaneseepsis]|uniref:GNAT family N-acetyltransferase n=1 Tax=Phototrophicus methaneseepsis TaxID=2710758 RepID=A0A7S8ED29_9CHLR|nr:GNAT family N-acetyltransferase [Phototrophicus methaneseepsis]QPC84619.1 GNAT family N-acetyltransferase [Phototrophicus methaneseepsis]
MSNTISLRILHSMEDFDKVLALQISIWQMETSGTTSPSIMNAFSHNGGVVVGAELDGRMIGFCLGFPAKNGDAISLWSHMAGVEPAYQGHGVGYMLKQAQRRWALENGYNVIRWTFDPLQRGNANFNFNRLGVRVERYEVNLYGEMTDSINVGLASDRCEAYWDLNQPHVQALAENPEFTPLDTEFDAEAFLVGENGDDSQHVPQAPLTRDTYCIEIPYQIAKLKQTNKPLAISWQLAVREAMLHALKEGYIAYHFVVRDGRGWYVFQRDRT